MRAVGGRITRRCRRTGASVAVLPLAPAAERQYRWAADRRSQDWSRLDDTMPYSGPRDTIVAVLVKLGIDPRERVDDSDQDVEYTACRSEEVDSYFRLYQKTLDDNERAVLCCFLLEGLNELIQEGNPFPRQSEVLTTLVDAGEVHAAELSYWANTSDPDPENWWPITTTLLSHMRQRSRRA